LAAVFMAGGFEVRPAERRVLANGEPVALGARAFDLLLALIELRERVVGKDELIARVWPGVVVEENNLTVQISSLRKVLGNAAITTVAGHGYRFTLPLSNAESARVAAMPVAASPSHDLPVLAVLAFDNQSSDAEMQFFSDGVSEEIIQRLSRGANLKVIGRTSSFQFRGERKAEAAERLACSHVLDGSIRRVAGRVRT
jgi:DNA-binding winged helix-turn-helix (wHTH) protein